jgi:hypothetical protein
MASVASSWVQVKPGTNVLTTAFSTAQMTIVVRPISSPCRIGASEVMYPTNTPPATKPIATASVIHRPLPASSGRSNPTEISMNRISEVTATAMNQPRPTKPGLTL